MRVLLSIMKKILFALFALASVVLFASDSRTAEIAKKLYGRIKIVPSTDSSAYRVAATSHGEDLRVKIVHSCANSCGLWQIVESGEDFRVQLLNSSYSDAVIRVKFVETGYGYTGF